MYISREFSSLEKNLPTAFSKKGLINQYVLCSEQTRLFSLSEHSKTVLLLPDSLTHGEIMQTDTKLGLKPGAGEAGRED